MKKNILFYLCIAGVSFSVLILNGCLSVPDSPKPRLYMPFSAAGSQDIQKFEFPYQCIIGVGPVKIPEYLNRPQIVTRGKDNLLTFAQFDRWAEPLDAALLRMLNENISAMLSGAEVMKFNWSILAPVKYQVSVDIIKIESDLDKDLELVAQWSIFDLNIRELIFTKRTQLFEPVQPNDYFGLNQALSSAVTKLSIEIAQKLSELDKKDKIR
ncbi:MAG: PqiC family protein [Candidatus Omnitrophota bacterium]|jgi:hypothetical protein